MDPRSLDDDREVTESSEHYEVARTNEGWGVWDRREPYAAPLAMYPVGDAGFEQAYEHFTRLNRGERADVWWEGARRASFWIAIVAGVVWIVTTAVYPITLLMETEEFGQGFQELLQWIGVVNQLAYSVFLVSFGVNVMLRLRDR